MKRTHVLLWASTVATGAGLLVFSGARYCHARSTADVELGKLALVSRQTTELSELRATAPGWMLRARPATGLTPRITAALAGCGLPASVMSSVSPEAETPVGDSDLRARRTRAVLTLTGITLPQLGAFLKTWRTREPQWTVSSLDLAPQGVQAKSESIGGDLPLRVVISLETLFVERSEPAMGKEPSFVNQTGGDR